MNFKDAFCENPSEKSDAVARFNQLALLHPLSFAGQFSSYDRIGGNNDGWGIGNFLYTEKNGEQVMADFVGAGVVHRLWFAGAWDFYNTYINFYFDEESKPRIHVTMVELFKGLAPFDSPLTGDAKVSSGGNYCYIDFPFEKSLKITTNAVGKNFFYQVGYELFPMGSNTCSWTEQQDNSSYINIWKAVTKDPKTNHDSTTFADIITLAANSTKTILQINRCASISSIKINIPEIYSADDKSEEILNNISLKIYWDNEKTPSVEAPLGSLFGTGNIGMGYAQAIAAGIDGKKEMYLYFPMPFSKNAKLELTSSRNVNTELSYEVVTIPLNPNDFEKMGYFKTHYTSQKLTAGDGKDYTVLDVNGTGHMVGIVQTFIGDLDQRYLEGNERIYIDNSCSPVWYGTGTEDLYNGGGYFCNGVFMLPLHGNSKHIQDKLNKIDKTAMYRYMLYDSIPFRSRITMNMEHGGDLNWDSPASTSCNNANVQVDTLVYYYYSHKQSMYKTDSITIGDESSERQHGFTLGSETWSGKLVGTFEGSYEDVIFSAIGKSTSSTSKFTLQVNPENTGVVLRRTFDQTLANQRAEVLVDGVHAGIWYRPGSNPYHKLRDDDFVIPYNLTSGKSKITIILKNLGEVDWSAFSYEVYCVGYQKNSIIKNLFDTLNKPDMTSSENKVTAINFTKEFTEGGWQWVDSTHNSTTNNATGSITIANAHGPLLTKCNYMNFTISCKISMPHISDNIVQAVGLMVYLDPKNYIKVTRESNGESSFNFSMTANGLTQNRRYPDNVTEDTLYLRITKIGDVYGGFYSLGGKRFTRLGDTYSISMGSDLKIGIYANTDSQRSMDANFSDFKLIVY